jgi:prepilin-type processing-associated H-X9-DG protein
MANGLFGTDRHLGNRALVTDTFSKGITFDGLGRRIWGTGAVMTISTLADTRLIAGMGIQAHRSAYNVLYGDGHVALYGDPQEKVVWHTEGRMADNGNTYATSDNRYDVHMATNYYVGYYVPFGNRRGSYGTFENSPNEVWHSMDVAGAVDVDAKATW